GHFDVRVAECLQRLRRKPAAVDRRTVDDEGRSLVRELLVGLHLEERAGDRDRARHVTGSVFFLLAHVDEHHRRLLLEPALDLVERDDLDRLSYLGEQIAIRLRHEIPGVALREAGSGRVLALDLRTWRSNGALSLRQGFPGEPASQAPMGDM